MMRWTVRAATAADAPAIATLVHLLDRGESQTDTPMTAADVMDAGFGERPLFRVMLAEAGARPLGYALFSPSYDTEHAAMGMYVNDLYVVPEARRQGVGRALMAAVARACRAEGGRYLFWNALEDNRAGRDFYRAIGARQEAVVTLSLQPDALERLAAEG